MSKKVNILVFALLLVFVVTVAYGPNDNTPKPGNDIEARLTKIEKKIDELIKSSEAIQSKLDDMSKKQDTLESLIRTRR